MSLMFSIDRADAGGFDVGGVIGGVMQGAIQADLQRQQIEREQQIERQQQLLIQRQQQLDQLQNQQTRREQPSSGTEPTGSEAQRPPTVRAPVVFTVDGAALGSIMSVQTLSSDTRCHPSEQFPGFQWCRSRKPVDGVMTSTSVILSASNAIVYDSKFYESATFPSGAVASEIERLSAQYHEQAQVLRMPGQGGDINAFIATWGALTLTQVDPATSGALASGQSVTSGVMVDFLNNVRDSAKRGLPIYRLGGGPGFYWVARLDRNAQGSLRFGASDAAAFDPPARTDPASVALQQAVAPPPAPAPPPVKVADASNRTVQPASLPAAMAEGGASATVPGQQVAALAAPPVKALQPDLPDQGRRVALVIGNSAYQTVPSLTNPRRDAEAVAEAFRAVGFESVTLVTDATLPVMKRALRDLEDQANHADWAVVYYAGHGIEIANQNYLIPIDAHLQSDRDAEDEAVTLDSVLTRLRGASKLHLVILDACRENPFEGMMKREMPASRDVTRGLTRFEPATSNEMVVYAAKAGEQAEDGDTDGHSPFAKALVARLAVPKVELNKFFRFVTNDVMQATNARQRPFVYGSTPGLDDFYFRTR